MAKLTNAQIQHAFFALIDATKIGTDVTYTQLGDTVRDKVPNGGWMQVRNNLQGFIASGFLVRNTADLSKELYTVLKHSK